MKKIMMIAAMMIAALGVNAQNEVGQFSIMPKAGINIATLTKGENTKSRVGLAAGVEVAYGVAKNFEITGAVLYSQQGVKVTDVVGGDFDLDENDNLIGGRVFNGDATFKLDQINIPILAQYYIVKGLAIKAGIQPGFAAVKKIGLKGNFYQGSVQGGNVTPVDETYSLKGEGVKGFQLAIPVGLSYEFANVVLDARYNIGVTKAFKDADSKHSVFQITLGYKFPF